MTGRNRQLKPFVASVVSGATKAGFLAMPTECERCGATDVRINRHHDDYEKPFDVIPLCGSCHAWRHKQLDAGGLTSRDRLRSDYLEKRAASHAAIADVIPDRDLFCEAIGNLPERQLAVLTAIAFDGLGNEQIAKRLGIAVSTVETHRARALKSVAMSLNMKLTHRLFTSLWWKHVRKK